MRLLRFKQGLSRRRMLIIGGAIVVLLIAGYGFWSMNTWNTYKTSYENWQKDLRKDVDGAIALPVSTQAERAKKKTAFKNVSNEIISAQRSLCSVSGMIAWQHVIGTLREREEACARIIVQASTFGEKMQQVTTYLEYEQTLTKALATAISTSSDKVTESTWGAQTTIWRDAEKAITKIPTSEALFQPVRTGAIDKVKAIEFAWGELIAAHTAKDKAKYTEAQAKLAVAYEALPSLANTSSQQFKNVTESLQKAYAELFKSEA